MTESVKASVRFESWGIVIPSGYVLSWSLRSSTILFDLCSERVFSPPSGCTTTWYGFTPIRALEGCGYLGSYLIVRLGMIPILFHFYGILTGKIFLKNTGQIFSGDAGNLPVTASMSLGNTLTAETMNMSSLRPLIWILPWVLPQEQGVLSIQRCLRCGTLDERTGMLAQGGKDQFSYLTGFQNFASVNVNGLHKDMVFSDMQSVLGLAHGGAGSKNI